MNMINIGLSGLNANKTALDVTAHNVANVNTVGYSRQQAMMSALAGRELFSAGSGVEVDSIRRVSDQFIVKQMWAATSQQAASNANLANMTMLESLLGGEGFNISAGLDSLFSALNDATLKPESTPNRQQIINEAKALSRRFNTLSESLHGQGNRISDKATASIEHANSVMSNIADINHRVVETQATGGNPSQLIDERDVLIKQLSEVVEISSTQQPNGSLQVTLASGQPLILGSDAAQLKATPIVNEPFIQNIEIDFAGQTFAVTGEFGGQLGAYDDYLKNTLKPTQQALNEMAENLASEFNQVLAGGFDLNGDPGQALFLFDPNSPAASLDITAITPAELALSSDGTPGNSDTLQALIDLSTKPMAITGLGNVSLNDAFASMVGKTAIETRQAAVDQKAAETLFSQANAARDNLSAVNSDEEAANLMTFTNAYQANMKVISTANELFDSVLRLL
ncbi:flagellar hook-associated protein FlgK [Photobacterium leiognathi]|uniref:flagellar hook-associated protein FlgK n=1 Tax=Photobacterium leiognathi TaxID=553611 RepID=UPI002738559D|nr:flagellar hook-associated protein FlgK [Photobacterium leiognathi]